MDLSGQKSPLTDLSLSDLRQLGRGEIEELVTAGLLEADRAAEIQSEDFQHKQDEQQLNAAQHLQAQQKIDEQKQDADWVQRMSQSYQQAYHQLMDTYDDAETEYGTIKTRAEELKDSLRQKIETAHQYGISLPDGEQAFLDRKNNTFVNGELQPLNDKDAKEAAAEFKLLPPQQQKANACYVDACKAYNEAADISQSADAGKLDIDNAKTALKNSNGEVSENELRQTDKDVRKQVDGLSSRLNKAQNTDANLDAALSADADTPADTPQPNSISFASAVAPNGNIIGDGNGTTATSFNAAANSAPAADMAVANNAPVPANRLPLTPAP